MRTDGFLNDKSGGVLPAFAVALLALIGTVGTAVDYGVVAHRRVTLQTMVDAATMQVARTTNPDEATLHARLATLLTPLLRQGGLEPTDWTLVSATDTGKKVTVSVTANVPTYLMSVFQVDSVNIRATTEVSRSQTKLEVALVLDNTGSMATNNRIGALRTAATTLVDTLYAGYDAANTVKIALVPFVTTVNIKAPGFDMAWIDQNALAAHHGQNFNPVGGGRANHLTLFNDLQVPWKGCVEARAAPYDLEDTPPNPAIPDTLFVPWFWPDEPDSGISYVDGTDYKNNYMPDDYTRPSGVSNSQTAAARQRNTSKYANRRASATIDETPSETFGPNKSCPEPLTPLTADANAMRTKIADMRAWNNSGTNIAVGMSWGWSVLSPTPPFTEGAPYEDNKTLKAMVILTDGENEVFGGWSTHNRSDYSGYGYLAANRLGTTNRATGVTRVNEKVTALCDKLKARNIRLYTITFQLASATGQALFRDCASKPELYFNSPSTSDLQAIFQAIGNDLGGLRFSQ